MIEYKTSENQAREWIGNSKTAMWSDRNVLTILAFCPVMGWVTKKVNNML